MPSAKTNLTIKGLDEAVGKMLWIADKKQTDRRITSAMKVAAKPLLVLAKNKVPVDSGALRDSLIINSRKLKNGNRSIRMGPQTGFVGRFSGSRKKGGTVTLRKPSKYAHLVEYGFEARNRKGGPVLKKVRARPFMRPANARAGGQKFIDRTAKALGKDFVRIAKQKLRAQTKSGGGKIL